MAQTITFDGSHNIVVQAQGDGVTVNVNLPYLQVVRRHLRLRPVRKDLDLLNPYSRDGVPLVGRRDELARLKEEWLGSRAPISVRCVIGRAGSGKTRLGLELCRLAHDAGWFAGSVEQSELARFAAQQNLGAWGWSRPTLLMVDYAAASAQVLRKCLAELAEHPGDPERPLRLLLLERHADVQLGWWRELTAAGGWSEAGVADLLDPAAPVPLQGNRLKEGTPRFGPSLAPRAPPEGRTRCQMYLPTGELSDPEAAPSSRSPHHASTPRCSSDWPGCRSTRSPTRRSAGRSSSRAWPAPWRWLG